MSTLGDNVDSSFVGLMESWFREHQLRMEFCLPAIVRDYDQAQNRVIVRPAIQHVFDDDSLQDRADVITHCFNPWGNNLGISFPLKPGDTGWLFGSDRDTTRFLETKTFAPPATDEMNVFRFGFFVPDGIRDFQIGSAESGSLVLGTTRPQNARIRIKEDFGIEITAGANTIITDKDNDVTVVVGSVSIHITGDGKIDIQSPTSVKLVSPSVEMTSEHVELSGNLNTNAGLHALGYGATGGFATADKKAVTVVDGIITSIAG